MPAKVPGEGAEGEGAKGLCPRRRCQRSGEGAKGLCPGEGAKGLLAKVPKVCAPTTRRDEPPLQAGHTVGQRKGRTANGGNCARSCPDLQRRDASLNQAAKLR